MSTEIAGKAPTATDIDRSAVVFVLLKRNKNNPGEGKDYPAAVIVPTIDEIYEESEDKKGNIVQKNRVIRYIPGEPSIYMDEQSDDAKYRPEPIVIREGQFIVDHREVLLIEFMRKSNGNANTKNRMPGRTAIYRERRAQDAAKEYVKTQQADLDMRNLIMDLDPYELEAYALVLGDKLAEEKDTETIRRDLLVLANTNPKKFKEGMENADSIRKVHIIKACKANIIICDNSRNEIRWPGGKLLKKVPMQMDAVDFLVSLSFQPSYKEVYEYIQQKLNPEPAGVKSDQGDRDADAEITIPGPDGIPVPVTTNEEKVNSTPDNNDEGKVEGPVVNKVVTPPPPPPAEKLPPNPKSDQDIIAEKLARDIADITPKTLYQVAMDNGIFVQNSNSAHLYVAGLDKDHAFFAAGLGKVGSIKKLKKKKAFKAFIYGIAKERALL